MKNVFNKLAKQEREVRVRDFVSPYVERSKFAFVKFANMSYRFRIIGFNNDGFGIFHPIDPLTARFVKQADFDVIRQYLSVLPVFKFIIVCETDIGWCACPYNTESMAKKIGEATEVIIRLASDVQRFDVINTRFDGYTFWFDSLSTEIDVNVSIRLRNIFQKSQQFNYVEERLDDIPGLTPEYKTAYKLAISALQLSKKNTVEGNIKKFLGRGQAELDSYVIRGDNIEIKWRTISNRIYHSLIDVKTMDVVSAGICLSGQDNKFHLKDLPGVVNEGERRGAIVRTRSNDED